MDGIVVSSDRVVSTGTAVGDVGHRLGGEIVLMHDLLGEIQAAWQSDQAAPRFARSMQGYLGEATALRDALLSQGAGLLGAGRAFAEAETAVAAAVPGMR